MGPVLVGARSSLLLVRQAGRPGRPPRRRVKACVSRSANQIRRNSNTLKSRSACIMTFHLPGLLASRLPGNRLHSLASAGLRFTRRRLNLAREIPSSRLHLLPSIDHDVVPVLSVSSNKPLFACEKASRRPARDGAAREPRFAEAPTSRGPVTGTKQAALSCDRIAAGKRHGR
jgi:hypothetical protein